LIKPIGLNQIAWNDLGQTSPVRSLSEIEQDRLEGVFGLSKQPWYLEPVALYHRCGIFCLLFAAAGKK